MQPRSWFYRQLAKQAEFSQYLSNAYSRVDWWYMQDQPPSTVLAHVGPALATGRNLVANGGFDSADHWTVNDPIGTSWSIAAGVAHFDDSDDSGLAHDDSPIEINKTYIWHFDISNAASGARIQLSVTNLAGGNTLIANTTYANGHHDIPFTAAATGAFVIIRGDDSLGAFDFDNCEIEQTGILASSAYTLGNDPMEGANTGITMGQLAGYNLGYAGLIDGINDYGNISSAEINSKFNPDTGTIVAFAKVANVGVWTDGAIRQVVRIQIDASNFIILRKTAANNTLSMWIRGAGGGTAITTTLTSTSWFMIALTWSGANAAGYINGVSVGTSGDITDLVGNLGSTTTVIGAQNTVPAQVWSGNICYVGLAPYVMTPIEIADIYAKAGI